MTDNKGSNGRSSAEEHDSAMGEHEQDPKWMYVNYLTDDHDTKADAYLFDMSGAGGLQKAVEDAVDDIKGGKGPVHGSPHSIEWNKRSYMVFVLDSQSGEKLTSVDFWHDDNGTRINETFKHEKHLKEFDKCTAISYINIRKNKNGGDLGQPHPERELYFWKTHHTKPIEKRYKKPESHENSGTNVGP